MAKPAKPQGYTAWAVCDKDDGRISYVCENGDTKPRPGYDFHRVIRVRVSPIRKLSTTTKRK